MFNDLTGLTMHSFFNFHDSISHGVVKLGDWDWVQQGLQRNIASVIEYYRHAPMAVKSDHFLVRLLGSIAVPKSQNLERYYDNVDAVSLNLSMALKMTSPIHPGQLFRGVFYGPGTAEVLVAHNSSFDFEAAHDNWQNLTAVKVLRTPRSDFGLNLPNGEASGSETGLAVVAVNLPMLAIQYRAFRLAQQQARQHDGDSQQSLMQFVHMYVLPNMLWSQTDQVLFNRLDRLSQGQALGVSHRRHPLAIPSHYGERTTALLGKLLELLQGQYRTFTGLLQAIPAITEPSMLQAMALPAVVQTRQVVWALTIARLPMLGFMFRESRGGAMLRSGREVNDIARSLYAFKNGAVMRQYVTDAELYYQVQSEIDDIMRLPETHPAPLQE
jgi:hypothetical protein